MPTRVSGFGKLFFPQIGFVGRDHGDFCRLLRGLCHPPDRRGDFRSLRRRHRAQEDIGHDVADVTTLLMTGFATFAVGLVPTYANPPSF